VGAAAGRCSRASHERKAVAILGLGAVGRAQAQSWSAPVSLGDIVNSEYSEDLPHLSQDGLSLYFISDRPPSPPGKFDIWVSERPAPEFPWGPPRNLGFAINRPFSNERGPCLSPDGHYLFFSSDRNPENSQDLWVSRRGGGPDSWGFWNPAVNLGPGVNTEDPDFGAAYLDDVNTGISTLMFGRREGFGDADIYVSEVQLPYWFGYGVVVPELSSPSDDLRPTVRADGLELFFNSNRPGSVQNGQTISNDLWYSWRWSPYSPWMPPQHLLGPSINTAFEEQYPAVSADGTTLIFSSNREPLRKNDLYMSTRLGNPFP
jgi:WD40 repeat protein